MSYLWLDVTTILGWHRPAVGIVRVESECAAYALEHNADHEIRFCRFEGISKRYVEVSVEQVGAALDRICRKSVSATLPGSSGNSTQSKQASLCLEKRLTTLVRNLIEKLPSKLNGKVFNFAKSRKPAFASAMRGCRELRVSMRDFLRPSGVNDFMPTVPARSAVSSEGYPVPFASGDVYISLGLDWEQKDLVYLFTQKRQVGFKVLLFCYDVIPVNFPHLCVGDVAASFARYFANLAWCANYVLCISECSRRDLLFLLDELGTPIPRLEVVRLGCDIRIRHDEPVSAEVAAVLGHKYILYVSTIERRKNHETLYRAYTRLVDSGVKDIPLLVFVGMPGWGVNELLSDISLDPRTKPYIRILNHVSDSDLSRLYKNAYFTVFPSIYEGWGLPVAESLAQGKFCLASNAASIPEVGGNLAEYLDPWDVQTWADRLHEFFIHPEMIENMERIIKTNYRAPSWQKTAADIFTAAVSLLSAENQRKDQLGS